MRTLDDELKKAGLGDSSDNRETAKKALRGIRRKIRPPSCKFCKKPVFFKPVAQVDPRGKEKHAAFNKDDVEHWKTCPYSPFYQKKAALKILKKSLAYMLVKTNVDLQKDVGLDIEEMEVAHAILEKEFKTVKVSGSVGKVIDAPEESDVEEYIKDPEKEEGSKVNDEISFHPVPTDPVGDPDEDIAPTEEDIKKEQVLGSDLR